MSVHPPAGFARRFVTVRGARFHLVEGGTGRPVMLVGGWPQSWYCWRHVMPLLAGSRRVIAVDPPGLGESDPPPAGDTASVAASFAALIESLALAPVPFIGYDIGAWIGYALAARHPAAVERLALIDAAIPGITPPEGYTLTPVQAARTWHFYFNAQPELPEALIAGRERVFLEWLFRERSGTRAGLEAHAVDEYVRLYSRADQLAAFAERIDSPTVGICYDIANAHFIGEDVAAGLRQVRARQGIVHLSDTGREVWRHDPVGQGTCDFAAFGATLREIGYTATSMLEIVADPPVEHIVESHRRIAALGWAAEMV